MSVAFAVMVTIAMQGQYAITKPVAVAETRALCEEVRELMEHVVGSVFDHIEGVTTASRCEETEVSE